MENNKNIDKNEDLPLDEDQLRGNTMNETIREVSGDADLDMSDRIGTGGYRGNSEGSGGSHDADLTQGMSYNPNDASAVRSGGTTDMDDQTAGGAGLNNGTRGGAGTTLTTKRNVTGSDFDGQDAVA